MKTHQKLGLLLPLAVIIAISPPAAGIAVIGCTNMQECQAQCGTSTKKYCCPQGTGTRETCPYGWELDPGIGTTTKTCIRADGPEYSDTAGYKKDTYGSCAPTKETYTCFVLSDAPPSGLNTCAMCLLGPGDR